jgi:serine protease Do
VLDELREGGVVSRGWLGVSIGPVDANGPSEVLGGALIDNVIAGGPAESAGLRSGDIITEFDGQPIDSARNLSRLVGSLDAGDEVEIEFLRNDERHEISTVLGELDEAQTQAALIPVEPDPRTYREFRFPRSESPYRR